MTPVLICTIHGFQALIPSGVVLRSYIKAMGNLRCRDQYTIETRLVVLLSAYFNLVCYLTQTINDALKLILLNAPSMIESKARFS